MHDITVISNWDHLQSEFESNRTPGEEAEIVVTKLLETRRLHSLEVALMSVLEEEGLEDSTLRDPVVPWDMDEQWDELTGKVLDLEKVVQGRLKELKKFERGGSTGMSLGVRPLVTDPESS
jgi:hypothetical protein